MIDMRPIPSTLVSWLQPDMQSAVRLVCMNRCASMNRTGRRSQEDWRDIQPCVNEGQACQGCIEQARRA